MNNVNRLSGHLDQEPIFPRLFFRPSLDDLGGVVIAEPQLDLVFAAAVPGSHHVGRKHIDRAGNVACDPGPLRNDGEVCVPFAALAVFQLSEYGLLVSVPSLVVPSR